MTTQPMEDAKKDFKPILGHSKQWGWIVVAWGVTSTHTEWCATPFTWQLIDDLTEWMPLPERPPAH